MAGDTPNADRILAELAWLKGLARQLVRDPHLADDVVQDAMVTALSRRPPEAQPLRAWLSGLLRNTIRSERRGARRRALREADAARADHERSTIDVVAELAWHRRIVDLALELEEPYRTAIVWRFLRGCTPREIARRLGVPVKTVHSRIERGVAKLRARLDRESGSRGVWVAALLPFTDPRPPALGALPGTILMTLNAKSVAAALVVSVVGALLYLPLQPSASPAAPAEGLESVMDDDLDVLEREGPVQELERRPARTAGAAAPSSAERPADAAPSEIVTGSVLDMQGRPVAGIEVRFEPEDLARSAGVHPAVLSAADGAFQLPLPEDRGSLTVRDDDHAAVVQPFLDGSPPTVEPIVVVAPRRSYAGRVVDTDGRPVEGATVEITLDGSWLGSSSLGVSGPDGRTVHLLLPFTETRTDAEGRFAFDSVGRVEGSHVAAERDGYERGRVPLPEESKRDLELVLAEAVAGEGALFGLVVDADGAPVRDALVSLGGDSVRSGTDGRFVLEDLGHTADRTVLAVKRGHLPGEAEFLGSAGAPGHSEAAPLVLRLGSAPLSIAGRVVDAEGEPVAGASVWSPDTTYFGRAPFAMRGQTVTGEVTVEAIAEGSLGAGDGPPRLVEAVTDDRGRFTLRGLLRRGYAVFAMDPSTLAASEPVVIEAGSEGVTLRLEGTGPWRIAGRVLSEGGSPLEGVRVSVGRRVPWANPPLPRTRSWERGPLRAPTGARTYLDPLATTDSEGRFAIDGLVVEGSFLFLSGETIVLGERVPLEPAEDLDELEIRVEASSRFRVVLIDPDEADALVHVGEDGRRLPLFVEVEAHRIATPEIAIVEGRSDVVQAREGDHTFSLMRDGQEVRRVHVRLAPGGVHELDL